MRSQGGRVRRAEDHREEWEELARLDPLWAILSYRSKKFGQWDEGEFFATGEHQVARHLEYGRALGYPLHQESALDFGCGVGRLAPALSDRFARYCGLDVSELMVARARRLHASRSGCTFRSDVEQALVQLPDGSFDLILSLYVLQHVSRRTTMISYLRSLVRLLHPCGLLVFQVPARIPPVEKLLYDTRRAMWLALRRAGIPSSFLHRYLAMSPMVMNFLPEPMVLAAIADGGGRVVEIERRSGGMAIEDRTYYATGAGSA